MNIAGAVLADQYAGALDRWPWLHDVEKDFALPHCLLFAVGSRETNLQERYTQGDTGDGGHGHGLFQLDDRWHDIPAGFDTAPRAQADTAAAMLADLYQRHGNWLGALNAYNSGSPLTEKTTGHDYGPDVLERRDYLAAGNEEAPMATAQAALDFYRQNDGLGEDPPGSNVNWISEWYGMTGAWCAMTVSRALIAAGFGTPERIDVPGVSTTSAKGWAYVPYLRNDFRNAGRYDQNPTVGDVVIFFWGPGEPIGDHTGILDEIVGDGSFLVWEGNTDEGVIRRKRRTMAVIDGFGHPPYSSSDNPPEEDDMALPIFGDAPESRPEQAGLWMVFGPLRHRVHTPAVWSAWEALGAKHVGTLDLAMFDGSIDIDAALAARIVVTPGEDGVVDYDAVGRAVADEMYGRLAS